jgi:hypothetical protein
LLFSVPLFSSIIPVNASNSHTIWVPNYETGYEPEYEESYSCAVCEVIKDTIDNHGNFQNSAIYHNATVSASYYVYMTRYYEENYDYCAVFSKGHCTPWGTCQEHYCLKAHLGSSIKDATLKDVTGNDYDFVFIWHCGTAEEYPSTVCNNPACSGYGEYKGMCYSWTNDNTLATNGHNETTDNGAEVFLGFINASYNFVTETGYDSYDFGGFAATFYYYLLVHNCDVKEALYYASRDTLGGPFESSYLCTGADVYVEPFNTTFWSYLSVYGNGDLTLP